MKNLLPLIDPFFGNGTIDLPTPQGIAATWFFIKAQTGNTHPGACAPLGMISACAHSGAYPTGYGLNAPNTHATPVQRFDRLTASGFCHLHQSGTGAIETYYNYLRVTPLIGSLDQLGTRWDIEDEQASPGYYAASLDGTGIRAELTASARAALHRYTFPAGTSPRLAIDFSAGGIDFPRRDTRPSSAQIAFAGDRAVQGEITMAGVRLYVWIEVDMPSASGTLWVDKRELGGDTLTWPRLEGKKSFGVVFDAGVDQAQTVHLCVGLSLRSVEQARFNISTIRDKSFAQLRAETAQLWNAYTRRIQVEGGTQAEREVFYSSLYHSLSKPANWPGESPYVPGDDLYVDFATMWDQYKTQLPLLLTIYPEHGAGIVNTLLSLAEYAGGFPNGFLLDADLHRFDNQSRSLAHYTIADAFNRRIAGIDWSRALDVMVRDLEQPANADYFERGLVYPITHTLDLAGACFCTAQLARQLGQTDRAQKFMKKSALWRNAYDPQTGKLIEAKYYEGGLWNYSFRLLHDMASRIGVYPSEQAFVEDLDRFFGCGQPPVAQPTDPADREYMRWGHTLNRFEGFNNEPDMETPYAYIYAGQHARTAEVVRTGIRDMFTTGRGGLPGNNDSGGLTSCHVWNAMGLFPVTGQPVVLIGSPLFDAISVQVGEHILTIQAKNNSPENIYVQSAALNGNPIDRAYITVDELLAGRELELVMGHEPSAWATGTRPPSYPPR